MDKPVYRYFKIVYRVAVHILLMGITAFVFLVVISDLLFPQFSSVPFLAGFLIICLMIAGLCLYGIWETTRSQLRIDRRLFGFDMAQARQSTSMDVSYFYSILNIYLIFNTTLVVAAWFIFPDQLSRAESLAYILTILSALSGYSSGVIKKRLSEVETNIESAI